MKLFILTIAAVLSLSGGVAVAERGFTAYGANDVNCVNIVEWHVHDQGRYELYKTWIMGWISASGKYEYGNSQRAFGDVANQDQIMHLVRNHCNENPLDNLVQACVAVVGQLLERAGR